MESRRPNSAYSTACDPVQLTERLIQLCIVSIIIGLIQGIRINNRMHAHVLPNCLFPQELPAAGRASIPQAGLAHASEKHVVFLIVLLLLLKPRHIQPLPEHRAEPITW